MIDIPTIAAQLQREEREQLELRRAANPEYWKAMFESMDRGAEEAEQERHDAWNEGRSYSDV